MLLLICTCFGSAWEAVKLPHGLHHSLSRRHSTHVLVAQTRRPRVFAGIAIQGPKMSHRVYKSLEQAVCCKLNFPCSPKGQPIIE